ncbi:MAG: hypothetical protein LBR15_06385 [Methanobrevibacter sp.]|jgi:hypothetical protein|nr:hypothetical protein [Candidatus Methanovirga australis]
MTYNFLNKRLTTEFDSWRVARWHLKWNQIYGKLYHHIDNIFDDIKEILYDERLFKYMKENTFDCFTFIFAYAMDLDSIKNWRKCIKEHTDLINFLK